MLDLVSSVVYVGLTEANLWSERSRLAWSADGRVVVFDSAASNLVTGDTNGAMDVFVYDGDIGSITRVSVSSTGQQGSGINPSVSADGRYVAFLSWSALAPEDTNGLSDIYVHDRLMGITELVSLATDGTVSADGSTVVFTSNASNLVAGDGNMTDVFVADLNLGTIERVSTAFGGGEADNYSQYVAVSADGRIVAFASHATNVVTGDTNGAMDVFVHDRDTGVTERVSVASGGVQGIDASFETALSEDGRFVAFASWAANLTAGDGNGARDVFVHDRVTGLTERASVSFEGQETLWLAGNPSLSADGRFVAFFASTEMTVGPVGAVYVHDRTTQTTRPVSVNPLGALGDGWSGTPTISADGRFIVFTSASTDLIVDDTNGVPDIFIGPNPLW
jgi:Tol biopolymer transport system component